MTVEERTQKIDQLRVLSSELNSIAERVAAERDQISSDTDPVLATAYSVLGRSVGAAATTASSLSSAAIFA